MTVTIIQGLWKEGSKKKKIIVKVLVTIGLWKEGSKKKNLLWGACDHMVLWNFKLRFEPSGLPPLTTQTNQNSSHRKYPFVAIYEPRIAKIYLARKAHRDIA
jgi:hypothetical protein